MLNCHHEFVGHYNGMSASCLNCDESPEAVIMEYRVLLAEIVDSIPSSYDDDDPMVKRHAKALNAAIRRMSC